MLCGVAPALTASRPVIPNSLKGESTLQRPGRAWTLRNILVVLQISLCLVLLCTTGLFLRSLRKTAEVDPGFRTRGVLMMSIDPVHNGYTEQQTPLLMKRLGERAAEVPGVNSVAWTDHVPLSFYGQNERIPHRGQGSARRTRSSRGRLPGELRLFRDHRHTVDCRARFQYRRSWCAETGSGERSLCADDIRCGQSSRRAGNEREDDV